MFPRLIPIDPMLLSVLKTNGCIIPPRFKDVEHHHEYSMQPSQTKDRHLQVIKIQEFCLLQKKEWKLGWNETRKLMDVLTFMFMLRVSNDVNNISGLEFKPEKFTLHNEIIFKHLQMTDVNVKENLSSRYKKGVKGA
jgi:hypothetical protein